MAKKQKTLEELLRWAKKLELTIQPFKTCVDIINVDIGSADCVTGKTYLSALRAAYRAWGQPNDRRRP